MRILEVILIQHYIKLYGMFLRITSEASQDYYSIPEALLLKIDPYIIHRLIVFFNNSAFIST